MNPRIESAPELTQDPGAVEREKVPQTMGEFYLRIAGRCAHLAADYWRSTVPEIPAAKATIEQALAFFQRVPGAIAPELIAGLSDSFDRAIELTAGWIDQSDAFISRTEEHIRQHGAVFNRPMAAGLRSTIHSRISKATEGRHGIDSATVMSLVTEVLVDNLEDEAYAIFPDQIPEDAQLQADLEQAQQTGRIRWESLADDFIANNGTITIPPDLRDLALTINRLKRQIQKAPECRQIREATTILCQLTESFQMFGKKAMVAPEQIAEIWALVDDGQSAATTPAKPEPPEEEMVPFDPSQAGPEALHRLGNIPATLDETAMQGLTTGEARPPTEPVMPFDYLMGRVQIADHRPDLANPYYRAVIALLNKHPELKARAKVGRAIDFRAVIEYLDTVDVRAFGQLMSRAPAVAPNLLTIMLRWRIQEGGGAINPEAEPAFIGQIFADLRTNRINDDAILSSILSEQWLQLQSTPPVRAEKSSEDRMRTTFQNWEQVLLGSDPEPYRAALERLISLAAAQATPPKWASQVSGKNAMEQLDMIASRLTPAELCHILGCINIAQVDDVNRVMALVLRVFTGGDQFIGADDNRIKSAKAVMQTFITDKQLGQQLVQRITRIAPQPSRRIVIDPSKGQEASQQTRKLSEKQAARARQDIEEVFSDFRDLLKFTQITLDQLAQLTKGRGTVKQSLVDQAGEKGWITIKHEDQPRVSRQDAVLLILIYSHTRDRKRWGGLISKPALSDYLNDFPELYQLVLEGLQRNATGNGKKV